MAKKPNYLKIDSFSKEDTKAMFDAICKEIGKITPLKAKQDILKLKGSEKELREFEPTLLSIFKLIAHYDIKTELKVIYMSDDGEIEGNLPPVESVHVKSYMEKQDSDIKDPDLKPKKNIVTVQSSVESSERGTDGPPDFE